MTEQQIPPGQSTTTEILLDALKRAAEAHGVHEAKDLGGVYDKSWPEWYAAHMTRTLADAGYSLVRNEPR
jgi:hypothetical protein